MVTVIDAAAFRAVLGHYPTGVSLVTAIGAGGAPVGLIVGTFTAVSLEPPLVAYLPMTGSRAFSLIRSAETFCINVLSAHQEAMCRKFASRAEDKWDGVSWSLSPGGAPILDDVLAWIECTTESVTEAGDHFLVMGRVQRLDIHRPASPLLFFQGGYGRFTMSSTVTPSTPELVAATRLAEAARSRVASLTEELKVVCDILAPVGSDIACVGVVAAVTDARRTSPLGWRIPLMAPFGEQYVAYLDDDAVERWLDRGGVQDEGRVTARLRLGSARERGWSLSTLATDAEAGFADITREYANGDLTPARERELRGLIEQMQQAYQSGDVDPAASYEPYTLAAPVKGPTGAPVLVLRLSGFPPVATGAQIQEWAARLLACASDLEASGTG